MESCQIPHTPPFISPSISSTTRNNKSISQFSTIHHKLYPQKQIYISVAALKNARGFGPTPKKKSNKLTKKPIINKEEVKDDDDDGDDQGVIPEVVTNRMMKRVGLSVGIPLFVGLLFFPFFYYLKVGLKIDIPTWVPFIVSFIFFGSALLGVSYGIVSSLFPLFFAPSSSLFPSLPFTNASATLFLFSCSILSLLLFSTASSTTI